MISMLILKIRGFGVLGFWGFGDGSRGFQPTVPVGPDDPRRVASAVSIVATRRT